MSGKVAMLFSLHHYYGSTGLFQDMGPCIISTIEMCDNTLHTYGVGIIPSPLVCWIQGICTLLSHRLNTKIPSSDFPPVIVSSIWS